MEFYRNPFRQLWYKARSLTRNIRNLIKWFPIIWRDRDFDQHYLLDILQFKLQNMAELHRKYGMSVNSETYAQQLEECAHLARRIRDEEYSDEAFKGHEELYEKHEVWFDDDEEGFSRLKTNLTDEEHELYMKLMSSEDNFLERDIHLLFENMKKNIRTWWD